VDNFDIGLFVTRLVVGSEAKLIRERDTLEQILQGQIDIFP
jgi:hypothetical protein